MEINQMLSTLLEEKEYRQLLASLEDDGGYGKEDAILMLAAIAFLRTGEEAKAKDILATLEKENAEKSSFQYYKGEELFKESERMTFDCDRRVLTLADAKSAFLKAIDIGLAGEMESNAVKYLILIEDCISDILDKED